MHQLVWRTGQPLLAPLAQSKSRLRIYDNQCMYRNEVTWNTNNDSQYSKPVVVTVIIDVCFTKCVCALAR